MRRFRSATDAAAGALELARRGGRRLKLADPDAIARETDRVAAIGATFLTLDEPGYPAPLAALEDAPPVITIHGSPSVLDAPALAIVGSRNASVAGRSMASTLAMGLGAAGYAIVSGLARGIDAAAHRGALETGTVAVLAGGLDRLYPPENVELAGAIADGRGALVTEMPLGWEPRGRDFPRRNRIISGLSLGVIVVEAARRSGSLITGRLAGQQGRSVFAVPGSPLDPRAEGANLLIRDGATLVTGVDDVLEDIAPMAARETRAPDLADLWSRDETPTRTGDDEPLPADTPAGARDHVVEALGPSPTEIDAIIRHTGIAPASVHLVLLELELAGRIQRHAGQRVSLIA